MSWLKSLKTSPIGLDIGTHSFKAVQAQKSGSAWVPTRTLTLVRNDPKVPITREEILRLHGVLDRRGFVGNDIVVSVPAEKLLTAMLELPPRAAGVPIDQIARLEFARVHKKDMSQLTMTTWELPASARASKVTAMLGAGASSADLESHLELLESANLNVIAIDEPHSASARGCASTSDLPGLVGIIDLGWTVATLTIVLKETIVYTRKLNDSSLKSICQEVADVGMTDLNVAEQEIWRDGLDPTIELKPEESGCRELLGLRVGQMLKEVGQAFGYASHRYSDCAVSKVVLIGGGGAIPGIAGRCALVFGTPCVAGIDGLDSALTLAMGLARWTGGDT